MTEPQNPPSAAELWLFGGIRRLGGGGYGHAWIEDSGRGETLMYKATGGYTAGSLYTVQISRTDDHVRMHGVPRYHGRCDDEALRASVEAAHDATKARQARERMERDDARHKAIDDAIAPLVDIARGLRTSADKDAFAAYVLRKINDAW